MNAEIIDDESKWEECSKVDVHSIKKLNGKLGDCNNTNGCITNECCEGKSYEKVKIKKFSWTVVLVYGLIGAFLALIYRFAWKFFA